MKVEPKRIYVPEGMFREGLRFSKKLCPIALALVAHGFANVSVDLEHIRADGLDIKTPDAVQEAIMAFDMRQPVRPFVFEV